MPEITEDIRELVEYGSDGVDCKDAEDLLHFVSGLIREHDAGQLPVDAESEDEPAVAICRADVILAIREGD